MTLKCSSKISIYNAPLNWGIIIYLCTYHNDHKKDKHGIEMLSCLLFIRVFITHMIFIVKLESGNRCWGTRAHYNQVFHNSKTHILYNIYKLNIQIFQMVYIRDIVWLLNHHVKCQVLFLLYIYCISLILLFQNILLPPSPHNMKLFTLILNRYNVYRDVDRIRI